MADQELATMEETQQEAKGPKRSKSPLLIILLLVILGGGGGAYWRFVYLPAAQAAPKKQENIKATLHLEGFVVNLADPDGNRYLRLGMDLGLAKELEVQKGKGGPDPTPAIRDAVLSVLSTRLSDDLLTPEGKAKLKDDLLHTLQDRVPSLQVREVYFTDFLVQ